jgi:LysM repeat protein
MSALPVEEQPSEAVPADAGSGSRGPWTRPGGATARPAVHRLFPVKKWLLPDGDCIFPGGGRSFSGAAAPGRSRSSPGAAAPGGSRSVLGHTAPGRSQSLPGHAAPRDVRPVRHGPEAGSGARRAAQPSAYAGRSIRPAYAGVPVLSGPVVAAPGRTAGAVAPHRLRLTRRGRIVLAVLAVIAVCGLFVAGASAAQASGRTAAHGGPSTAEQVVVQPGDTLWSIAQGADPNADARTVVQEILQANRLTTASITAGQRLWVP